MSKTRVLSEPCNVFAPRAVVGILKVFTDKLDAGPGGRTQDYSTYSYELMQQTGYGSGKVYSILMRLVNAG